MLPFVSPGGIYRYRNTEGLRLSTGELVVDIDGLPTRERARKLRDELFGDNVLRPDLTFVSPSDYGVKLILPYEHRALITLNDCYMDAVHAVWSYLDIKYGIDEFIDKKNIDIARACFLAHDSDARLRDNLVINNFNSYTK